MFSKYLKGMIKYKYNFKKNLALTTRCVTKYQKMFLFSLLITNIGSSLIEDFLEMLSLY